MTLDDQLRDMARHADQQQQAITAEEIVQRGSRQGTESFTTNSRFDDHRKVDTCTPVQFIEDETTTIELEASSQTSATRRVVRAALAVAAAAATIALVTIRINRDLSPG